MSESLNLFQKVISDPKFDPYDIFSVKRDFTLKQLTKQYHKKALKYHPDKGGSALKYNIVMYAYKMLCKEHASRNQRCGGFRELKEESQNHHSQQSQQIQQSQQLHSEDMGSRFDAEVFNNTFSQNPLDFGEDDTRSGYESWMKNNAVSRVDENKEGRLKTISTKKFNRDWTEKKKRRKRDQNKVIVYKEPEPSYRTKIKFSDIDLSKPTHFNDPSIGAGASEMSFRDYKDAFTNSEITNVTNSTRKTFNSVEDVQQARTNIEYEMSDHGKMQRIAFTEIKKMDEKERQSRIRHQNMIIAKHAEKLNSLLLR